MTPKREDKPTREEAKLTLDTILKRLRYKKKARGPRRAEGANEKATSRAQHV
jgi:hypothetical protein